MADPDPLEESYIFWTNKGGVGKTTLCFQMLVAYAQAHPDTKVLVVDMDPQANLSCTLLTQLKVNWNDKHSNPGHSGYRKVIDLQKTLVRGQFPKTVLGVFQSYYEVSNDTGLPNPLDPSSDDIIVNVATYNNKLPGNIKLLCGDFRLKAIEGWVWRQSGHGGGLIPGWARERARFADFLRKALRSQYTGKYKNSVVFTDANPSLDVATEIALLSSRKLILPLMFDQYSTMALKSVMFLLHHIGVDDFKMTGNFDKEVFARKVKEHHAHVRVPLLHAVIFNKCRTYGSTLPQADSKIFQQQIQELFEIRRLVEAEGQDLARVFNFAGKPAPNTAKDMAKMFACHMTDMNTLGMISMSCGLPMWLVKRHRDSLTKELQMSHASASDVSKDVLVQIIGTKRMIENSYTIEDSEIMMVPLLAGLLRGQKQIPASKIHKILTDFDTDATESLGASSKRQKRG